jgi:DNA polymerase-3 subunit delta
MNARRRPLRPEEPGHNSKQCLVRERCKFTKRFTVSFISGQNFLAQDQMTNDAIEKSWKSGKPMPVYVFHGEEEFLRNELIHQAADLLVPDESTRSFNFDLLYGADTSVAQIISVAQGYPMMAERRVVIVREAEKVLRTKPAGATTSRKKKSADQDPLLAYLERPNPDCVLIFDTQKLGPKNQSPFRELVAKAEVIEFPMLKDGEVSNWVRTRAKHLGRILSEGAARLLVGHLGTSLRSHANELEKLITYTSGRTEITEQDVEQVVGASRDHNVFELTKAIGQGNKKLALTIALRMLAADKDQIHVLFVMISRYLEQLTIAHELSAKGQGERDIADALELKGGAVYFVKDTIAAAKKYSAQRLDQAMRSLLAAEESTRRTGANSSLIVEKMILGVLPA